MIRMVTLVNSVCNEGVCFRYLQTLHSISAEKNSTIIFPLPMELLGGFIDTQVEDIASDEGGF